jgi:two-component system response regulator PilR (NtrC family)
MNRPVCLVVDDEPDILELMVTTLTPMDIECETAENVTQALECLRSRSFNLCLTDMRLPDGNGLDLVDIVQREYPNTPIAVITAHGSMESAVKAFKAGAFDFIAKPLKLNGLRNLVSTALRLSQQLPKTSSDLVGESKVMQDLRTKIEKLARSQAPIYIKGESGAGKEVVARTIHKLGVRADKPFIPVNCGAIPIDLMEGEFFGHKKGSFTGAHADKVGLFQEAHGGTLFLDEVGDLPLPMQVKLLRAIQERQIRPIGASKEVPVDVRILSATHHDLAELVKQNKFRQDLFYRINVIELHVPPLREHPEDIPILVDTILSRLSTYSRYSQTNPCLTEEAMDVLKQYRFPGNVRELENILERATALCENNLIKIEDLQLPKFVPTIASSKSTLTIEPTVIGQTNAPLEPLLNDVEKERILSALERAKGNKTQAAKLLGISFGALRYRLQKLDIT